MFTQLLERFVVAAEKIAAELPLHRELMTKALTYRQSLTTGTPLAVAPVTEKTPEPQQAPVEEAPKKIVVKKPAPAAEPEPESAPVDAIPYQKIPDAVMRMYDRAGEHRDKAKKDFADLRAEYGVANAQELPEDLRGEFIAKLDALWPRD